jgi:phosphoglycolate phosphatase-like HAD superfamily hydrolase
VIRVVLFDIDGTLIRTGGAGRRAFALAVEDVLDRKVDDSGFSFGGRTDIAICRGLLSRGGVEEFDAPLLERVFSRYLVHLDRELDETEAFRLCAGVSELLETLSNAPDFRIGLLTGNIEIAARRKLAHIGIDRFFPFGAFGSDEEDRDRLVPIARDRAGRLYGAEAASAPVVLVGDTPLDIRCARAGNARILAVATGIFDRTQLDPYGPDVLMDDLSRTDSVMAALYTLSELPPPPAPESAIPDIEG